MATPLPPGGAAGKRCATLRRGPASLTRTAGHAPIRRRGGRAGEGAP
ncbi:DUF6380 family protein [Streptomyces chlorus]|uniref:DUF6380 family protein n=1 Tax=Streptomyces chlorus TaxID=887452 RepID=A0ABW1E6G9_9ACTN